jgi:hypothetical protein
MTRFRDWFLAQEDSMTGTSQYGNSQSPDENGLRRPQFCTPPPDSPRARKLFGIRKMSTIVKK